MSEVIDRYVEELAAAEADYTPNEEVQRSLHQKTFVGIVGPLAVGKSTVVRAVCELDTDFHEIQGYTTRPRRPGEQLGEFREFWPHDETSLEKIVEQKDKGELVQYTVHPETKSIYAAELIDLGPHFNLLPLLPRNLVQLENAEFKYKLVTSLVCSPHEWQKRFEVRAKNMDPGDIKKRLVEARNNLTWSLEHSEAIWVKNRQNKVQEAARKIIAVTRGLDTKTTNHRKTGEKLLRHLEWIITNY